MSSESVDVVVALLLDVVKPASVAEVAPGAGEWAAAFRRHGVPDAQTVDTDFRSPVELPERVDLAVSIGAGEQAPVDLAPEFVASLCTIADVVAFASALPGLTGAPNERWPAWWDSLFAQHGYERHDVVRVQLWDDDRVDITVRQGLALYAPPARFDGASLPPLAARNAVHPEAHERAVELARRRDGAHVAMANGRIAELEAQIDALNRQLQSAGAALERVAPFLAERGPALDGLSPLESHAVWAEEDARDARTDAVLLWMALAVAQRDLSAATNTTIGPSRGARRAALRWLTGRLRFRSAFRRILGPRAKLFDERFYLWRYPDASASSLSPLWHYRRHGARAQRSPHPFFDAQWYGERYPEVGASALDGLEDYLDRGWREGREPHPLFSSEWYASEVDLAGWTRSPLEHYLAHGAGRGVSPHPLIDAHWYAEQNPDVVGAGVDPVAHFLSRGWWEGRAPHALFDLRWYLARYAHVGYPGLNPLADYLANGWRLGRDPHPLFDVAWYLDANPDVVAAGVEPLTHYVTTGAAEGRAAGPMFDTAWYVAAHPDAVANGRNPLEFYVTAGAARGDQPSPWAADGSGGDERLGV